ncbi:MAG TPA: YbaB/EbfC family nucleoid-associated protein [Pseudonocardiaceae bacterium]|jgi:DNA-binding protein YbaB|nr:YbaB/EbfC family nucleoid-associated protein [Pseudonocardiaceae bacterium]
MSSAEQQPRTKDLGGSEQWLAQYKAKIAKRTEETAQLEAITASTTGTARSEDGAVTVTVSATGQLRDLRFGPKAAEHNPAQLSAVVMRTVAQAQRSVADQLIEACEETETGAALVPMITDMRDRIQAPGEEIPANAFDELAEDPPEPAPTPPPPAWQTPQAPAPAAAPPRRRTTRAVQDDTDDFSEEAPW